MKEKVIIQQLALTRKGELKAFQVKLPFDAKRIIGFETNVTDLNYSDVSSATGGVTPPSPGGTGGTGGTGGVGGVGGTGTTVPPPGLIAAGISSFQRSLTVGELRMQSCGKSNLFYSTDVTFIDRSIGLGDFSQSNFWINQIWTHGHKREEDVVSVDECCPILLGTYRDKLGEALNIDTPYKINVYLWYSTE